MNYESFTPNEKYLKKSYMQSAIFLFLFLFPILPFGFFGLPFFINNLPFPNNFITILVNIVPLIVLSLYTTLVLLTLYLNKLQYRALNYEITDSEIQIKNGVIFKRQIIIPFRTITNIDMIVGPFDRLFGLGTVNIQTAGSISVLAEGRFVGLIEEDAETLRTYLKNRLQKFQGSPGTAIDGTETQNTDVELVLDELRSIKKVLEDIRDQ